MSSSRSPPCTPASKAELPFCRCAAEPLAGAGASLTLIAQGNLAHPIQPKTSMWTLEGESLSLYLQKQDEAVKWTSLFKA